MITSIFNQKLASGMTRFSSPYLGTLPQKQPSVARLKNIKTYIRI